MIKAYRKIENIWFHIQQKIRFLLVGGFNTLLSYLLFIWLVEFLRIPYQVSLIIQYLITVNISIFTMRYYVFRAHGKLCSEYTKAWITYLSMLAFNYLFLYLLIDILQIETITAQGIYVIISSILMYIIHQNITFKPKV